MKKQNVSVKSEQSATNNITAGKNGAANTKSYQVYCRSTKQKVVVSKDFYESFQRNAAKVRMKHQRNGTCCCSKRDIWMCDGDCEGCKFRIFENIDSLDADEENGGGYAAIPDKSMDVEKLVRTKNTLEQVIRKLRELDKDADRMIEIWLDNPDGISDRALARQLGRNEDTFKKQIKKIRKELDKIRE